MFKIILKKLNKLVSLQSKNLRMTATKKSASKKKFITDTSIITLYMDSVLSQNEEPKNVYIFCKENKIDESDFYAYYGSLEALKQDIWLKLFENAKQTIESDANFLIYSQKDKVLTLYFTLVEVLNLNRSYVSFALRDSKNILQNLHQMKTFRNHFKSFIVDIVETETSERDMRLNKVIKPFFAEGIWVEFLFILKFWLDDTSKGFEKTDVMIEKAVKATFDFIDTTPVESLFDLGKFVWKEKFN